MNPAWLSLLLVCLHPPADSQAVARAIIIRAIVAEGGEARLSQQVATHSLCKGRVFFLGDVAFTGETWTQKHDQVRQLLRIDAPRMRHIVLVLNGHDGWLSYSRHTEPLEPRTLALVRIESYVDRVTNLVPLLKEKQFHLAALGESMVEGQPVVGVKVTAPGQPDVLLYFTRDTGLLCKREYRAHENGSDKIVTFVSLYSDYHALDPARNEERTLEAANIATDGPSVVRYLRKHSISDADLTRARKLIRELGSHSFHRREKAAADLVALGASAIPLLQEARRDHDPEIARRARDCLRQVRGKVQPAVLTAVIRLVALRRPPKAVETLLAFAPSAPDDAVGREVVHALKSLADTDSTTHRVLLKALDDPEPGRRRAATIALGRLPLPAGSRRIFLGGIQLPRKIRTFRDNERSMEYETLAVEYFDHFDGRLFEKP